MNVVTVDNIALVESQPISHTFSMEIAVYQIGVHNYDVIGLNVTVFKHALHIS